MINNIIFDLGNVILKGRPKIVLNSLELEKNKIEEIENQFFKDWRELDLGEVTIEEHWNKCKFSFDITEKTKEKLIHYYKYRPFNEELIELIKELKEKNYKIYILSNNNIDVKEYLLKLPFFKNINGYVFSCDYQLVKPNPEIYNVLFRKYNLLPNECFFIDDKEQNIEVGKALGMNGFVFKYEESGVDELLKVLRRNEVNC